MVPFVKKRYEQALKNCEGLSDIKTYVNQRLCQNPVNALSKSITDMDNCQLFVLDTRKISTNYVYIGQKKQ